MSRVLVTGGAGTIGAAVVRRLLGDPAYEVRVADQRPAPQWMREGCEVHTGDLRVLSEAKAAIERLQPRDPPGGDRRGHRQPPPPAPYSDRGQQRALQRRDRGGPGLGGGALHLRLLRGGVRARERVPDAPRRTCRTARRRGRPTASPSSPARSTAAPPTTSMACPTRSAAPSDAYGPGEVPGEPGASRASPMLVPDLIAKVLSGQRPLQIFGSGEQTQDADPRARTSPMGSSPR